MRPRGRRRAPGKPLTYGTTDSFLAHFGLNTVKDLPGFPTSGAGLLDGHLPPGFAVPDPRDVASLMPDELPLEASDGLSRTMREIAGEEPMADEGDERSAALGSSESSEYEE